MKFHGRIIINPQEKKLLIGLIKNSVIFQNPQDNIYCVVIYYAESSNNVVNVYNDKRISF